MEVGDKGGKSLPTGIYFYLDLCHNSAGDSASLEEVSKIFTFLNCL